jgi:hypothetical protein
MSVRVSSMFGKISKWFRTTTLCTDFVFHTDNIQPFLEYVNGRTD